MYTMSVFTQTRLNTLDHSSITYPTQPYLNKLSCEQACNQPQLAVAPQFLASGADDWPTPGGSALLAYGLARHLF